MKEERPKTSRWLIWVRVRVRVRVRPLGGSFFQRREVVSILEASEDVAGERAGRCLQFKRLKLKLKLRARVKSLFMPLSCGIDPSLFRTTFLFDRAAFPDSL